MILLNKIKKTLILKIYITQLVYNVFFAFFNWDSLHATLNSHYKAWSYKKKEPQKD